MKQYKLYSCILNSSLHCVGTIAPRLGLGVGLGLGLGSIILEPPYRNDTQTTPFCWLINVTRGIISSIVYLISLIAYLFVNTHTSEVDY